VKDTIWPGDDLRDQPNTSDCKRALAKNGEILIQRIAQRQLLIDPNDQYLNQLVMWRLES